LFEAGGQKRLIAQRMFVPGSFPHHSLPKKRSPSGPLAPGTAGFAWVGALTLGLRRRNERRILSPDGPFLSGPWDLAGLVRRLEPKKKAGFRTATLRLVEVPSARPAALGTNSPFPTLGYSRFGPARLRDSGNGSEIERGT
jgi:hypothetical protein